MMIYTHREKDINMAGLLCSLQTFRSVAEKAETTSWLFLRYSPEVKPQKAAWSIAGTVLFWGLHGTVTKETPKNVSTTASDEDGFGGCGWFWAHLKSTHGQTTQVPALPPRGIQLCLISGREMIKLTEKIAVDVFFLLKEFYLEYEVLTFPHSIYSSIIFLQSRSFIYAV